MSSRILVTYASQGGSTAGVAEAIGKTLSGHGLQVDVLPVGAVRDLNGHRAAVLGSAIHSGKWMPEMMTFIERHQNVLRQMPTAAFQVCLMQAASQAGRQMAPSWFAALDALIHPAARQTFAGALWPERYPKLTDRLGLHIFLAVVKLKAGDYRDWDAIHRWADSIHPLLDR